MPLSADDLVNITNVSFGPFGGADGLRVQGVGHEGPLVTTWLWVKNRVTPKWVALLNGNMD